MKFAFYSLCSARELILLCTNPVHNDEFMYRKITIEYLVQSISHDVNIISIILTERHFDKLNNHLLNRCVIIVEVSVPYSVFSACIH